jgi:two-component system, NtrC family, sensor histidine kinase AtoS
MHGPLHLIDKLNDAVFIESFEQRILAVNPKACEMYGYSREEFLALPVAELVPPEERWRMAEVQAGVASDQRFLFESKNLRKGGEAFPAEISGAQIEWEGQPAMAVVVRDVTARKDLEKRLRETLNQLEGIVEERTKALRESEERYRYLFEQASDILYETDLEGRFLSLNEAAFALTGFSREEGIGRSFVEFIDERDLPRLMELRVEVLDGAPIRRPLEVRIRKKGGGLAVIEFKEAPRYKDGRIVGTHGVARDITERKLGEARRRETEQLVTLGKLVTSIAHEIRNPLFGISSIAQILSGGERGAEERELFEAMLNEIDRLNRLISELLQFGRPQPLKIERFVLGELAEEIGRLHQSNLEERELTLALDFPAATWVSSDRAALGQVLTNLLLNAISFSAPGRAITLQARQPGGEEGAWEIAVHNFGPAIPPPQQEQIFELFYSTRVQGTGLGLAICRQLMNRLEGTIAVESSESSGTTFRLTVPPLAAPA